MHHYLSDDLSYHLKISLLISDYLSENMRSRILASSVSDNLNTAQESGL